MREVIRENLQLTTKEKIIDASVAFTKRKANSGVSEDILCKLFTTYSYMVGMYELYQKATAVVSYINISNT